MKKQSNDTIIIKTVVDRIEEDKAVLITDDNVELIFKKKMLPSTAEVGEAIILTIETEAAETKRREEKAKEILNELLRS